MHHKTVMSGLGNPEQHPASSPNPGNDDTASFPYNSIRIRETLPDSDPLMQLLQAFKDNNLPLFRNLLYAVDPSGCTLVDPNHRYASPSNATCLEMACNETDRSGFVNVLLQCGSDPNQMNPFNNRRAPMHLVAEKSCVHSLRQLLNHNSIDINMQDALQNSALHLLAKQKTDAALECVSLLLDNMDINVNQKDGVGHTALDIAIKHGSKEIVQTMLDICGKRLNLDTPHRLDRQTTRTLLMDKFKDIKKIPEIGHDRTSVMELKQILFSHLHKQECDTFIAELDRNEVNILEVINKNDGWNTYLQYATKYNLRDVVKRLLEMQADPNVVTTADRRPALVIACVQRDYATVHLLLQLGVAINIDAADGKGNTALHWAARNRDLEGIVTLISHGADYHVRNNLDEPPLSADATEAILDRCLSCNDCYPNTDDYELIFDYSVLVAHEQVKSINSSSTSDEERCCSDNGIQLKPVPETEFLHRMSMLQQYAGILKHPIVSSFLDMKWQRCKYLFYTNLIVDLLYIMCLAWHLNSEEVVLFQNICMLTFITYYNLKDILKICSSSLKEYAKEYENYLNLILIAVAYVSICRLLIPYELTHLFVSSMFLVAFKSVLIVGRVPQLCKYNAMLRRIFVQSCALLSCFSFVLLAFSYCFHGLFRTGGYYPTVRHDIVTDSLYKKTLMMTGGISAEDAPKNVRLEMSGYDSVRIFVIFVFVFIISIVLINTLIGLAVQSVLAVQSKKDELAIKSKIKHIYNIEKLLIYCHDKLHRSGSSKKSLNTSYGIRKPFTYSFEKCNLFSRISSSKKIITIAPNKHNLITLPKNVIWEESYKIHNRVVGKAMKIISQRHQNKIQTLKN